MTRTAGAADRVNRPADVSPEPTRAEDAVVALPAASGFGVWRVDTDDQVVVAVVGELDMGTAPKVWEVLAQAFEHDGLIAIDLSGVTFMDSQGLKLFVRAYKRTTREGGRLVLRSPQPLARRVFEVTGLDKVLDIED